MAEVLLQFYTKATALVMLPLLKSNIAFIKLLSSHMLQKFNCTQPRTWWCYCTVHLTLHLHLSLGCKGAASAHHPAKGLGLHIPVAKWAWKSTERPWVSAGLQRICGSLWATTAFRNKDTGHCSGVDESSHMVVCSRSTGFSTPRLTEAGS